MSPPHTKKKPQWEAKKVCNKRYRSSINPAGDKETMGAEGWHLGKPSRGDRI
jgi:hypothetical protein